MECCNIVVICVAFYPVAIVLNFIAIAVISEFDNYVYASMRNECMKKIIEEREINEEIFESFEHAGGEHFTYIPCLNDDEAHITALSNVIRENLQGWI